MKYFPGLKSVYCFIDHKTKHLLKTYYSHRVLEAFKAKPFVKVLQSLRKKRRINVGQFNTLLAEARQLRDEYVLAERKAVNIAPPIVNASLRSKKFQESAIYSMAIAMKDAERIANLKKFRTFWEEKVELYWKRLKPEDILSLLETAGIPPSESNFDAMERFILTGHDSELWSWCELHNERGQIDPKLILTLYPRVIREDLVQNVLFKLDECQKAQADFKNKNKKKGKRKRPLRRGVMEVERTSSYIKYQISGDVKRNAFRSQIPRLVGEVNSLA